jgi:hypothetical protein
MARVVLVLALLLAGCGSGGHSSDAARPVERHLRALSENDFAGACSELTLKARGEVIGLVAQAAGSPPGSCEAAYRSLVVTGSLDFARAGVMDLARAQKFGRAAADVSVDDVSGAHAQAHVSGSRKVIYLERGGGGWKISQLDFSDLP